MSNEQDRNFFKPLSSSGKYRYNPNRSLSPRVFATPRFYAMLQGQIPIPLGSETGFQICLDKLSSLYPVVNTGFMEGGHGWGGFWIRTIWSSYPNKADVIIVRGPGDVGYFGLPYLYEQSQDESLLVDLILIDLPYIS